MLAGPDPQGSAGFSYVLSVDHRFRWCSFLFLDVLADVAGGHIQYIFYTAFTLAVSRW